MQHMTRVGLLLIADGCNNAAFGGVKSALRAVKSGFAA